MFKKILCLLWAFLLPLTAYASDRPILVSIGLSSDTVTVDGRNVKAAGIGKRTPWGIHEADVIYETMLYPSGQTRLGCLFGSRFPESVGPVRSARIGHFLLQQEWDALFVYNGDAGSAAWNWMPGTDRYSKAFLNTQKNRSTKPFVRREKGVKAPDNLSVQLKSLADEMDISENFICPGSTLYDTAFSYPMSEIILDWGAEAWQTRLNYEPEKNQYLMYRRNVPFLSSVSAQDRQNGIQLAFDCVIVQHVNYQWPAAMIPVMPTIGEGKAEWYGNGQQFSCIWRKESPTSPTRYWDADGNEIALPNNSIYIALFPALSTVNVDSDHQSAHYVHNVQ